MSKYQYYNPVRVHFGIGTLAKLPGLVAGRSTLLVTSPGFVKRGVIAELRSKIPQIVHVLDKVQPNPTIQSLESLFEISQHLRPELIVGLGGGSVLDASKVLALSQTTQNFTEVEQLIKGGSNDSVVPVTPMILVPTTSGTGSEVTPWGTVWDMHARKKYSLHLPNLWAEACICDPELMLSLSHELSLQTGLDALSHSLEAIWNRNANPVSTMHSIRAARIILATLPQVLENPENLNLRSEMMQAALHAGLSFCATQTALAHAVSYFLTLHQNVPHGIACSFTLPDIIASAVGSDRRVDSALQEIFGSNPEQRLRGFLADLDVSTQFADYGVSAEQFSELRSSIAAVQRSRNSLVDPVRFFDTVADEQGLSQ